MTRLRETSVVGVCFFVWVGYVTARPSGAPWQACEDMRPRHGNAKASTNPAPFRIILGGLSPRGEWRPGRKHYVTLQAAKRGAYFKGFFCQARSARNNQVVGTWHNFPTGTRASTCLITNSAFTHINPNRRLYVTAQWKAPQHTGPIRIVCTVVKDFSTFWVGLRTGIARELGASQRAVTQPPTTPSPPTTSASPQTVPTQAPPPVKPTIRPSAQETSCTQECPRGPRGFTGRRGPPGPPGNSGDKGDATNLARLQQLEKTVRALQQKVESLERKHATSANASPESSTEVPSIAQVTPEPEVRTPIPSEPLDKDAPPNAVPQDEQRERSPSWSAWYTSHSCSVTCGTGVQHQRRACTGSTSTRTCPGAHKRRVECRARVPCPRTLSWGSWTDWSSCTATCGFGTKVRTRTCTGGNKCRGHSRQNQMCTNGPCQRIEDVSRPPAIGNCAPDQELGMQSGRITNSQLNATSFLLKHQASQARLNGQSSWVPKHSDRKPHINVDLKSVRKISAIDLQGHGMNPSIYTKTLHIDLSQDGATWKTYAPNGDKKICRIQRGQTSRCQMEVSSPLTARYIRLVPETHNILNALRFELYGCSL